MSVVTDHPARDPGVQTVLGRIDPAELGWTLPHEHTAIALWHIANRWDYWELRRDEPLIEIHPVDATRFGVTDDSFARIVTDYGQCILKAVVSERAQRGMLFAPIHWSEETASAARVGALVAPFTDPFSGQPENKATPASITAYEYVFRGFALSRTPLQLPPQLWWTRVAV